MKPFRDEDGLQCRRMRYVIGRGSVATLRYARITPTVTAFDLQSRSDVPIAQGVCRPWIMVSKALLHAAADTEREEEAEPEEGSPERLGRI